MTLDRILNHIPVPDRIMAVAGNGGTWVMWLMQPSTLTTLGTILVSVMTGAYFFVKTVREWRKMDREDEAHEEWRRRRWVMCPECDEFNPPDARRCESCDYRFQQQDINEDEAED